MSGDLTRRGCGVHDERIGTGPAQAGIGMVGLIASLAVLAVLAAVAVTAVGGGSTGISGLPTLPRGSGASGTPGATGPPSTSPGPRGVMTAAADLVAQQNLDSSLALADQVAVTGGGYGDVDATALSAQDSRAQFTAGPSTGAGQVSVAAAGGSAGSVALAVRSASGTCWFAWRSSTANWYGVSVGAARPSCAAPTLPGPPGAGGHDDIEWRSGAFPAATAR